ncbi:MAG: hypothetical protein A2149_08550 [Candidatus Schekmanbacteria bacterium RBG_16_38_11]|uniref:Uncharacterized protein n=1 Tax=Candidatus Schekmanbacteria bacterium RBG_16_38_11 TaxID=1817880 RepID=A0A1F7RUM6_9BACT|nr:MAG: hypothetical protein A2149_08550 [Candidatus Schekmanbacteria bacterium RBG_16_38_11]
MGEGEKKFKLNIQKFMELVANDCKNYKTTLENVKSYVRTHEQYIILKIILTKKNKKFSAILQKIEAQYPSLRVKHGALTLLKIIK